MKIMSRIKLKIKKGDEVIVIAGRSKGKQGKVLKVCRLPKGRSRLLVEGVNMVKKHVKPNPNNNEPGGIKDIEAFIDISNVMLFDLIAKKGGKIGFRTQEDGKKQRYFKSTGEMVNVDDN
jgi:large subunit ribosomal protein L24